mmetsp:Transcript_10817/g.26166  ORF Transcript_10817/g.26166 Transcript_10817/m.26166 type:complete len:663 (-) Transcript_10817:204-2192(-)
MERDKGRSSSRKGSRGHKSSSSSKHHQSSRHKSSRSSTSSGEKSKERERSPRRSTRAAPGAHSVDTQDSKSLQKSQLKGESPRPPNVFNSRDDLSDASDGSFDPVALANERTAHYAQHQLPPPRSADTLVGDPEAPSRGSSKKSDTGSLMVTPAHSVSSTYGSKSSSKSVPSRPSDGGDQQTVLAHEVVPLGLEGTNIRQLDASIKVATMDVERMAEENRAFQARLQAENEAERQRMLEENNKIQREIQENFERQQAAEAAKRKRQRQYMKLFLLVVVLVGIGVGAYFGTRSSSPDPSPLVSLTSDDSPTQAPATPNATPTVASSYDPPNAQDCANMEKGLPRANANDYQGLLNRQIDVVFTAEVPSSVSSSSTVSSSLLSVLEQQIERLLRPELVGCSKIGRRKVLDGNRQLLDFDYLIYDLEVSMAQDTESACTLNGQSTQPCHVLVASMNVWLQGEEPNVLVWGHIFEVLNNLDLPVKLELEGQFDVITVRDVRDQIPSPIVTPTESPVLNPTASPVEGVVPTPEPTPEPTPGPTPEPTTPPPTDAPGSTGSCDLSQYFWEGFYYEFEGGDQLSYVVDCSIFAGNRGLALEVDENSCNFECVGRKEPQAFDPYCRNKPSGTAVELLVGVDSTGSKIYLGTDAQGRLQQFLECDPPMIAS